MKQKYANLIHNTNSNDSSSSLSSSPSATIETTLDDEYNALQATWQSTLNRRHANLRLISGGATTSNYTKFKIIDRSFWSQVEGTVRHDAARTPSSKPPPTYIRIPNNVLPSPPSLLTRVTSPSYPQSVDQRFHHAFLSSYFYVATVVKTVGEIFEI